MTISEFVKKYGVFVCFFPYRSLAEDFCAYMSNNKQDEFSYYYIENSGYFDVYKFDNKWRNLYVEYADTCN